jgi:phosphoribosylanthranilate isomerase
VWAFLLDSYTKGISGGTGKKFDWDLAKLAKKFKKPIFLAGGIGAQNVKTAIKAVKPFAVDLCSSVEKKPGLKSGNKLVEFFQD